MVIIRTISLKKIDKKVIIIHLYCPFDYKIEEKEKEKLINSTHYLLKYE